MKMLHNIVRRCTFIFYQVTESNKNRMNFNIVRICKISTATAAAHKWIAATF